MLEPQMLQGLVRALRDLPRTAWVVGWVSLLTDAASDMIYPLLPELLGRVGATAIALGVMEGVAEALSAVVKIASGRAADRSRHAKGLVVAGYGLSSVARPLMSFARAGWLIIVLRVFDRLGKGIRGAPRDALLAAAAKPEQRGLAFGVHRAMDNMGAVIGGTLSFVLLGAAGLALDTVLLLSIIPGLLSTAVALFFIRAPDRIGAPREPSNAAPNDSNAAPSDPKSRAAASATSKGPLSSASVRAIAVFGVFALSASADSFLMAHATKLGLPLPLIPLAWISLQLAKSLLNVPGGHLADKLGPRVVVAGSYAMYAISYVAFAFVESPWVFWGLLPLYAFYYGFGEGAERSLLVAIAPESQRGQTIGMASAVQGLGLLPANVLFGVVYASDPSLAFELSAGIAAAAFVLLLALVRAPGRATERSDGAA
jgi:sugar phosphate permease